MNLAQKISPSKQILLECLVSLPELKEVETLIREKFASEAPLLSEISDYLLQLGGKRVRPALCLLISKAISPLKTKLEVLQVAAGIELIHMATLLHDDIIDKADLRRHSQSPFTKFGLGNTLLTGDFLLVRAFSLCAHLDNYIIDITEKACIELTEGEILETPLSRETHNLESSLNISRKKTASLFRLASESAAYLAGVEPQPLRHFAAFGENLGMAFQALDDILDVISPENLLGKAAGTDLREQKPSLINVLWLESDPKSAEFLTGDPSKISQETIKDALSRLRGSAVVNKARSYAISFVENALNELKAAEDCGVPLNAEFKAVLEALANYCLERME